MSLEIHRLFQECPTCVRDRVALNRHTKKLRLFPSFRALEHNEIDIIVPLTPTSAGKKYLLVIFDRFTKLCIVAPLRAITAEAVSKEFITH